VRIPGTGLPFVIREFGRQGLLVGFGHGTIADRIGWIFVIVREFIPTSVIVVEIGRGRRSGWLGLASQQALEGAHLGGQKFHPATARQSRR